MKSKKKTTKVAQRVKKIIRPKPMKKNRTLSLDHENFERLRTYCQVHGLTVSEVVDELIREFLIDS